MKKLESRLFDPPSHLSDESQQLWRELVPRRAKSPERRELLCHALEIKDRLMEVRVETNSHEFITKTLGSGNARIHPAIRLEMELSKQFLSVWKALNLDWAHGADGMDTQKYLNRLADQSAEAMEQPYRGGATGSPTAWDDILAPRYSTD